MSNVEYLIKEQRPVDNHVDEIIHGVVHRTVEEIEYDLAVLREFEKMFYSLFERGEADLSARRDKLENELRGM